MSNKKSDIHDQRILILDFGSQYTQLIARRVREIGVFCELWAWDVTPEEIQGFGASGIILAGGPESVTEKSSPRAPEFIYSSGIPILGICYGLQCMTTQLGGTVSISNEREFGYAQVEVVGESELLKDVEDSKTPEGKILLDVWQSHGDKVEKIPDDFKVIAKTDNCPFTVISNEEKKLYGVQFHPEVTHTKKGMQIMENFVLRICGCQRLWTPKSIIEDAVARIKEKVGDDEVILGLSGGVDSSVTAMLIDRAIGKKLTCVFVDNGLLRLNEGKQVMDMFGDNFGLNVIRVDAEKLFLDRLKGVSEPERKRKIIGNVFVEIFNDEASKRENAKWLAQGTIYPDVIESAGAKTGKAEVIKSHHNVGGLPKVMKLGLVEPLRELFKDEVRKIGLALGLPHEMLFRHPFPGPGLGVRILGEVKKEYCDLLRKADAIFMEELIKNGLYQKVSQAFTVFLPVRSVGVMGDGRKYDWVVCLRAVETVDFMTAKWAHLPYEFLGKVSSRIINQVAGISRVVYDISGKPPATIEWE